MSGPNVIDLPDYPWFPNDVMVEDRALLEAMVDAETGPVERALFGRIPLRLLGHALTAEADSASIAARLWIMHLSGYFGGVWLRAELARAQPDAPILGVDVLPDATVFAELTAVQRAGLDAAHDDASALAYSAERFGHHLDGYGYNHGYLTEILEAPPAGLRSPPDFLDAPGLLDARYSVDGIDGLAELVDRCSAAAERGDVDAAPLLVTQMEAHERGRLVWSTGLSVQGFPQREYDQLLELSAYFLQGTQAAALAMLLANTEQDVALARRAAVLDALLEPWSVSYRMGLLDGRPDRRLPSRS